MSKEILRVSHLSHNFFLSKHTCIPALNDVSFSMKEGEILGIVGESGSGKSTIAKCVMNIIKPSGGKIFYDGIDICDKREFKKNHRRLERERQIIFQDSTSSLNKRMKVSQIIAEPMQIAHIKPIRGSLREEAKFQLKYVGMDESYLDKRPSQLSGGQRQRVAIARALSMEPKLLVADEPIASLDVSIQAQIVNLFKHLREEHGFSILFIAHDLSMVEFLCDSVAVMYKGRLVEKASAKELYKNPLHPYTKALLSSIPLPDPIKERSRKYCYFDEESFVGNGKLVEELLGHFVLREENIL